MANLDLERMSVLLVEDSPFMRSLLVNCLKLLGVGTVLTAEDGTAAIKIMKLVKTDPVKAGVMEIDMVFSNWQMSPVDGLMLLRWIRRHKESPNRFLPVVMISGYSEPRRVEEARDMGANEFLTKPFTINSIVEHLRAVIMRPRQYVHTKDFFGPDRRRRKIKYEGDDRRLLDDDCDEVEVLLG